MPQAHPIFFGPEQRPLFGWLHRPDAGQALDAGLLICSPLGYDAISSHRTLRHLAEAAAARGIPALRFDYDGTGDSAGQDTDPAREEAWIESIRIAQSTLRKVTGVHRVCVFGIRLGASLALLAAQSVPEITGAILVNPVTDGRRYLRELRALAATSAMAEAMAESADQDIQQAAGFITTMETRQTIGTLRLAGDSLSTAPPQVLLLERTDLPTDDGLPNHLRELRTTVTRQTFPGYADMLRDAHETTVPVDLIQDALDWLQDTASSHHPQPVTTACDTCTFTWSTADASGSVRERAVCFGSNSNIFGIVTDDADGPKPLLLLLNSGAVHHVGPNRLYVRIARLMALRGFRVLRLDLPGLGDSPVPCGKEENQTYPDWAVASVGKAVNYARASLDASEIHCGGICSGAYYSLKSAVAGQPFKSIVVINPLTFFWKPGMSLAVPAFQDTAEMMRYRRTALSGASLRKLFSGKVDLINLAGILTRYSIRRTRHVVRRIGRKLGVRLQDDLVTELRNIQSQQTSMHFVFSDSDPGHAMLQESAGAEVSRLQNNQALTIQLVEHSDHTFTPRLAQEHLLSYLAQILSPTSERPS